MTRGRALDPSGLAAFSRDLDYADDEAGPGQGLLFGVAPADPDGVGELADSAPRGRGRPAGSRNKSTAEWSRFLLSRYRSPLLGLAEIAASTPQELQAALGGARKKGDADDGEGVSLRECLGIIMQAAASLAPYLHQKQPLALDAGGAGMMTIVIQNGTGATLTGARMEPIDDAEEIEQNQSVTFSGDEVSE